MGFVFTLPNAIQKTNGEWTKEVELDEMTGVEEDILSDQRRDPKNKGRLLKSGSQRFTDLLSRCTVRIGDESRPADKDRFSAPDYFEKHWSKAFSSDRSFAIIRVRQLSLGNKYISSQICPVCGFESNDYALDLNDLKVIELPLEKASLEAHALTLPSGMKVEWRFLRGDDEYKIEIAQKANQADFMTAMLFLKLVSMNGERPVFDKLKRLTTKDRNYILQALDVGEGGVDNQLVHTCHNEECKADFKTRLDAGKRDFFFPTATL